MKKKLWILFILIFLAHCGGKEEKKAGAVRPVYDPVAFQNGDYFTIPFPHYLRVKNGSINIHDFPGFSENTMLRRVARQLEESFTGFGLNSAIFVPFTGELSEEFIPTSATDSVEDNSPIFLLNIDPDSPHRGEKIPILLKFYIGESKFIPSNTLIIIPLPGFPLQENSWYALVFMKGIKDAAGNDLQSPPAFEEELNKNEPPLSYLTELISSGKILFAVPFRTGDATSEMKAIAEWYETVNKIEYEIDGNLRYYYTYYDPRPELEGKLLAPQFQRGKPPYLKPGEGKFIFDEAGKPVVQRWEWVRFSILLPNEPPPPSGYPIVIYAHGTGGDFHSYIWSWVGYYLTSMGYAVIGFDQPLHGARNPRNGGEDLYTFNFINPVAMRDNMRQGAADLFAVRKLVEEFSLSQTESPTGWQVKFDMSRAGFFGHSQGAITGAIYLAVENFPYRGVVLSGSSGDLIMAFLYKVSPVNIPGIFKIFLGEYDNYTLFNPVLSVFQILAEPADPLNYGSRIAFHEGLERPRNVFISEGLEDEETPPPLIEAFASTVGVTPVEPIYRFPPLFGLKNMEPIGRPVWGNKSVVVYGNEVTFTATLTQYPGYGHFACFDSVDAIADWTGFMKSLLTSEVAVLR